MSNLLIELLAERDVLIADGAMGTSLFGLGLATGDSPEIWNVLYPERVASVHQGFVEAGADLILTNTFGANRYRLQLHDSQTRVQELNQAAARIARQVADQAGRPVMVAGSIGPTGEIYQPIGPLDMADGEAAFREQALALAEAGVDLLWIETISGPEEMTAAIAGAKPTGLPIVATLTFDTNGCTMMGVTPKAAMDLRSDLPARPAAYGANCGIGPAQLVDTIVGLTEAAAADDIIVAKGNCGVPEFKDGHIHYDGTPEVMATYARLVRDAGARIIGGCCGTGPDHVRAMVQALAEHPTGVRPTRAAIERALGPVAAPADANAAAERAKDQSLRRRRRRRGAA